MTHDEITAEGKLRELRMKVNLTQEAVAEAADCSPRWYQTLEYGKGNPSRELAERLAKVLDADLSDG